jgi:hypothetical protein
MILPPTDGDKANDGWAYTGSSTMVWDSILSLVQHAFGEAREICIYLDPRDPALLSKRHVLRLERCRVVSPTS